MTSFVVTILSKARLAAEAETELMITVDMILVLYGFKKRYRLSLHKYTTFDITVQVFNNIIVILFKIGKSPPGYDAGLRVLLFLNQPVANEPGLYRAPDVLSKQAGDQFAMISVKVNGISLTSEFGF